MSKVAFEMETVQSINIETFANATMKNARAMIEKQFFDAAKLKKKWIIKQLSISKYTIANEILLKYSAI